VFFPELENGFETEAAVQMAVQVDERKGGIDHRSTGRLHCCLHILAILYDFPLPSNRHFLP
jgi:hypothetical protein